MNMPFQDPMASILGGNQPLFAGAGTPRYPADFDLSGIFGNGPMSMIGSQLLTMFAGPYMQQNGFIPAQFAPQQNLIDQYRAKQYYDSLSRSTAIAAQADTSTFVQLAQGAVGPLTASQEAGVRRFAQDVSMITPLLAQVAPEALDSFYGSRGSAVVMAQAIQEGSRFRTDPLTGRMGMSGEAVGELSKSMFDQFFGPQANLGAWHGMSAGRAGELFRQLQQRGMMGGVNLGLMGANEQLAALSGVPDAAALFGLGGDLSRLAGGDAAAQGRFTDIARRALSQELIRSGSSERIDDRLARFRGQSIEKQVAELSAVDGVAQEVIRDLQHNDTTRFEQIAGQFDARQIGNRLQNLSGAVKAMREIFGDMGKPNAPMTEILNGLNALTQGGLATMAPGDIERSVRMTQALAQNTGIGMQGMQALVSRGAGMADAFGMERIFAVQSAQGAAAFGAAFGEVGRPDIGGYGRRDTEHLTAIDQQLRMTAANSELANRLNLAARIQSERGFTSGSAAEALAQAVQAGKREFSYVGADGNMVTQSVFLKEGEFLDVLASGGVGRGQAISLLQDRYTNQEYGQRFNTGALVRQMQREDGVRMLDDNFAMAVGGTLRERFQLAAKDVGSMSRDIGRAAARKLQDMDPTDYRSADKRNRILADAIKDEMAAKGLDVSKLSDQDFIGLAMEGYGNADEQIRKDPRYQHMENVQTYLDLNNKTVLRRQEEQMQQATYDSQMREAMAGLGQSGIAKRISNWLISGTGSANDFLSQGVLGAQVPEEVARRLEQVLGGGAAIRDESAELNKRRTQAIGAREEATRDLQRAKDKGDQAGMAAAQRTIDEQQKLIDDATSQRNILSADLMTLMGGGGAAQKRAQQIDEEIKRMETEGKPVPAHIIARRDALRQAASGGIVQSSEQAGVLTGVTASSELTAEAVQSGRQARVFLDRINRGEQLLPEDRKKAIQASSKAAQDAENIADVIFSSVDNVKQLGGGGLDLLESYHRKQGELAELAREAGMSIGELLADGSADGEKARTLFSAIQQDQSAIQNRQKDPSRNPVVTAAEEDRIRTRVNQMRRPGEYAKELAGKLTSRLGASLSEAEQEQISKVIGAGGARGVLNFERALAARDALARKAKDAGYASVADYVADAEDGGLTDSLKFSSEDYALVKEAGALGKLGEAKEGSMAVGRSFNAIHEAAKELQRDANADTKAKSGERDLTVRGRVELIDKTNANIVLFSGGADSTPAMVG